MMTPVRWQTVRDVLQQAMELAPEKRGRFLDVHSCTFSLFHSSTLAFPKRRRSH